MRPIELAPVKHCLPVLKSPGTDHGDIAHTHTGSQTHAVQTQESADTQQQSRVANHYWTHSNKAQNEEKRSRSRVFGLVGGWWGWAVNSALKFCSFAFRPDCGNKMFSKMLVMNSTVFAETCTE